MVENEDPRAEPENLPEDPSGNVNWLDELADDPDSIWDESSTGDAAVAADIIQEAAGDEIPDWLKADLEQDLPSDEMVPDWLVPEIGADDSFENDVDIQEPTEIPHSEPPGDIEPSSDEDATILIQPDQPVGEDLADDEEQEEKLNWLEQIKAGEVAATEEATSKVNEGSGQADGIYLEESESNDLAWINNFDSASDPGLDGARDMAGDEEFSPEHASDHDQQQSTFEELTVSDEEALPTKVPEDPDEAMAWLENLAAKQGAPIEELPSIEGAEKSDADSIVNVVDDAEIGDSSSVPNLGMGEEFLTSEVLEEISAEEEDESETFDAEDTLIYDLSSPTPDDDAQQAVLDSEDIPDDPDEAMIWIEKLAAQQGAQDADASSDQGEYIESSDLIQDEGELVSPTSFPDVETGDIELSGDLDEALNWLEEMVDFEEGDASDLVKIVEEPVTPHVVHDVELALEEASLIDFEGTEEEQDLAESEPPGEEMEVTDDTAEAFAWLDHLAESESDLPEDLVGSEPENQMVPDVIEEIEQFPTMESTELSFEALDDPLQLETTGDDIDQDMAWLDTLGAVRVEEWLAAEVEVPLDEAEPVSQDQASVEESGVVPDPEEPVEEAGDPGIAASIANDDLLEEILDDAEKDRLIRARSALENGNLDGALEEYESLLVDDSSLPFVIADLEGSPERLSGQPLVQRTLGDAYVRNGQVKKALEVYRQALDSL